MSLSDTPKLSLLETAPGPTVESISCSIEEFGGRGLEDSDERLAVSLVVS